MSQYLPPTKVNLLYNAGNFDWQNKYITLSTTEPRYLRKSGSDVSSASITFNGGCTFNSRLISNGGIGSITTDLVFYTGSLERMRVVSGTGYIGVGTYSPAYMLHVNGSLNASTVYENTVSLVSKYAQLGADNVLSGQQTVNNNVIISGQLKLNGVIRPYATGTTYVYNLTQLNTANDVLVGRNTSDILSNKTLIRPMLDTCILNTAILLDNGVNVLTGNLAYVNGLSNSTTSADIAALQVSSGSTNTILSGCSYDSGTQTLNMMNNLAVNGSLKVNSIKTSTSSYSYSLSTLIANDVLIGRNTTDTLTLKTLVSPKINTSIQLDTAIISTSTLAYVNGLTNGTTSADISNLQATLTNNYLLSSTAASTYLLQSTFNSYIPSSINTSPIVAGTNFYLALTGSGNAQAINTNVNLIYNATTNTLSSTNLVGALTGSLSGVATTSNNIATTITTTGTAWYVPLCNSGTSVPINISTSFKYDATTGTLSSPKFIGNVTGIATTATNIATTTTTTGSAWYVPLCNSGSSVPININTSLKFDATTNTLSSTNLVGALTGSLSGVATTANNIATTTTTTGSAWYVPLCNSGSSVPININTSLKFDATTNTLSSTNLVGALTGSLSGVATTANNIATTSTTTGSAWYVPLCNSGTSVPINISTSFKYDATTGTLSSPTFIGNVTGIATTANNIATTSTTTGSAWYVPLCSSGSSVPINICSTLKFDAATNTLSSTNLVGALTGSLSGVATTANNIATTSTTTGSAWYVPLCNSGTSVPINISTSFKYDATTGTLSSPTFIGNVTGVATTANNIATTTVSSGTFLVPLTTTGSNVAVRTNTGLTYDSFSEVLKCKAFSGTASQINVAQNFDNLEFPITFSNLDTTWFSIAGPTSLQDNAQLTYNPDKGRLSCGSICTSSSIGTNSILGTTNFSGITTVTTPTNTNNNEVPNTAYITSNYAPIQCGNPTGAIIMMAATASPAGYLLCNGASVSRTTYASLFAVIGTVYGSSGATVFNLPDFRGAFLRGAGTNGINTNYSSGSVGTAQIDQTGSHNHAFSGANGKNYGSVGLFGKVTGSSTYLDNAGTFPAYISTNATDASGENRPYNYAVYYFIKT